MNNSAKKVLITGVTLICAGAIAIAPSVTPPAPQPPAVHLSAAVQPLAPQVDPFTLSVLGTHVKVGSVGCSVGLFGLVPVPWPGSVDRSWGRGGAPAAQRGRTTSRPAGIRRILLRPRDEAKHVVEQVICCLP